MDARDQRIAELETENAGLRARVVEIEQRVESLLKMVMTLEERLSRSSGNSNQPPSSDSPGQRADRRGKGASGRKRGGQPGHSGSTRALLPPEQVDQVTDLFPPACENCWAELPQTDRATVQRVQTLELPPFKPHVTEWRRYCITCPTCRYRTWASATSIPTTPFGPRLSAVIGLLTGVYHLSRRSAASLLSDVLGVDISLGAISAVEERVSEAVKPAVEEAWTQAVDAPVKHTDGTSWFRSGVMCSLWTMATSAVTVFKILADGKATTLAALFRKQVGILVSDRATALNFWAMERRQICWAHLLRKAISFSERDGPTGRWGHEMLDYIGILFDYWGQLQAGHLSRDAFRARIAPVRLHIEALLERGRDSKRSHLSGSCEDMLAHRSALWTFVDHEGVEPTNNHAERELRAFVLWRKRSFGTQSERGNLFAERLMTVAHTARKQRRNVLEFLTACCSAVRTGDTAPSLFASPC